MLNNVFPTDSASYFPVSQKPVFVMDEHAGVQRDPNHNAVVREDTGEVLAINTRQYKLVTNREAFAAFEDAVIDAGVDLQQVRVSEGIAYGGRTTVRDYIFPGVSVRPALGDPVEFKLQVINSYHGGNAFQAWAAGLRLRCLNGQVLPDAGGARVHARHTNGFDAKRAVERIHTALESYLAMEGRWARWAERDILHAQAYAVFEAMPGSNPSRNDWLAEALAGEAVGEAPTVWSLYNALTRWSTHAPVRKASSGNRAAIVLEREAEVARTLRAQAFTRLAA